MCGLLRSESVTIVKARALLQIVQCEKEKASITERKTYQKSNASMYDACEEQKFEDFSPSEETMYHAEQTASV